MLTLTLKTTRRCPACHVGEIEKSALRAGAFCSHCKAFIKLDRKLAFIILTFFLLLEILLPQWGFERLGLVFAGLFFLHLLTYYLLGSYYFPLVKLDRGHYW